MGLTERDLPRLGARVADEQDAALERAELLGADARLAALHLRESAPSPVRRSRRARWAVAIAATLAIAVALVFFVSRGRSDVSYRIGSETGAPGQWVGADDAAVALEFSEGSRVDVRAGARARVTDLGAHGASLVVERGTLHVSVVPRGGNDWQIVGGPFAVHVVGTEFDVAWDPSSEALTVAMVSGRVRIEGPCIEPSTRTVSAPESVRLTCTVAPHEEPTAAASSAAPPQPTAALEAPAPALTSTASVPAGASASPSVSASSAPRDPGEAATTGHELVELGSAARLAGDAAGARRLYEATRKRFPGTDAAAVAAYHLGRMAFDGQHAWADAERWFGVYLAESPGGALAPEALGRSMESADKRGDHARARALAERYLAAYPKGAQAALATRLASEDE
jgi:TolA-binding protein